MKIIIAYYVVSPYLILLFTVAPRGLQGKKESVKAMSSRDVHVMTLQGTSLIDTFYHSKGICGIVSGAKD